MTETRITESFEFKTDVITAYDGSEQRIKTRQIPRHSLSFDYDAMNLFQAQWLRGMSRIPQSDLWYVPLWCRPGYLREDFIIHGKSLYINTDYTYNFEGCEWIEIFVEDDYMQSGTNLVCRVDHFSDGIITLRKKIDRPLLVKNTWIFPLFKFSVKPSTSMNYVYSNGTAVTLGFEDLLLEPSIHVPYKYRNEYDINIEKFNQWNMPSDIDGVEVLLNSPQWLEDESVKLQIDRNINRLDAETGVFIYDMKNYSTYDVHSMDIYLCGIKKINNMIKFFNRRGGKYQSFYCPTYANDFELIFDVLPTSNTLYTKYTHLYKFYANNSRKKKLIVFTKDWHSYIYDIMAYSHEVIGGIDYGKLILSQPVDTMLKKDNVLMISYFNRVRFDNDTLVLNYESNVIANTTLVMREVDDT